LESESFAALLPPDWPRDGSRGLSLADFQEDLHQNLNGPNAAFTPTPAQVARTQALLDEARGDFDKAIQVEPQAAVGYIARSGFRAITEGVTQRLISGLRAGNVTLASVARNVPPQTGTISGTALADLHQAAQAAQAAPDDLLGVSMAALFQALALVSATPPYPETKDGFIDWNALPLPKRQPLEQDAALLARLAQSKDDAQAGQAAEGLGTIWFLLGRFKEAEGDFRLAIKRAPQRQGAWDGLLGLYLQSNRLADAATLGEQRLKAHEDANARLALAKTYEKLNQPAQVTAQIQAAFQDAPDDVTVCLAEAALLLRRSDDPSVMPKAKEWLDRAETLYQKNKRMDDWKNYTVLFGAYLALTGNEAEARKQLAQVLNVDKDNKEAKQVLAAMGPSETP
ncbi:MAG: hypothetical protein M3Y28_12155, partial [Armatimonadota bacterium]|nr:hypothetical protein [Armatimonadota bacterium]